MENEIQDYVKRPKRYQNIDGTGEMGMGMMFLGFALLSYLQSVLPKDSMLVNGFTGVLFMYVVLIPVMGLGWWGGKAIKKHITYPRTGYVVYRRGTKSSIVTMVVAMVVSAGVAAALFFAIRYATRHNAVDPVRLGLQGVFAAAYVIFLCMSREHPWKWFVALFMAFGLVVISFTVSGGLLDLFPPTALLLGLTWLASGGITLYLYIRRTQPPTPEAK